MLHRFIPLPLLLAIVIAGCYQTPILYAPPTVHAPMLQHGGDAEASISLSGVPGADVRAAVSPVDHLTLAALGSWLDRRFDSSEHAYHRYLEFGIGTYAELSPSVLGELMAGYGFGHALGFGRAYRGFGEPEKAAWPVSGDYRRYFLQADIAYTGATGSSSASPFSGYAFVLRAANVAFDEIVEPDSTTTGESWFFESALVFRKGIRAFQIEAQLGLSSNLSQTTFEGIDLFGSMGMRVALHDLF